MPIAPPTDVLVPLRGGFTVRTSVLTWLIDASFRLRFSVRPDGRLLVAPRSAITPTDDEFIREHRDELLAAVRYCDEQSAMPL